MCLPNEGVVISKRPDPDLDAALSSEKGQAKCLRLRLTGVGLVF